MRRGSITVFLALILSASLVFVLVVAEASRYAGLRLTARQAGETAINSLFASFDRDLLEDYGLLFYDGGRGAETIRCEVIENDFQHYFYENANQRGLLTGGSFFRIGSLETDVTEIVTAVDYNGEIFVRSALDFFKYDGVSELADRIREELEKITQGTAVMDAAENGEGESLLEQLKPLEPAAGEGENGEEAFDHDKLESDIEGSAIGAAEKVRAKGWLWLALPGSKTVSGKKLDQNGLPSLSVRDTRVLNQKNSVFAGTADTVLFNEYLLSMFRSFMSDAPETGLHYEIEYLITGKESDDKALRAVLDKLLLIREGMNMLNILTDNAKRATADQITAVLVGWTGIAPLIATVELALIAAWAFAESIMDMRILLCGGRVPVVKTVNDWSLSLPNVVDFLLGAEMPPSEHMNGLSYEDYLRLMLFTTNSHDLAYRAMDLIQTAKRETNPSFTMASQIYAIEIRTTADAAELFSALPAAAGKLGYGNTAYEWEEYFAASY